MPDHGSLDAYRRGCRCCVCVPHFERRLGEASASASAPPFYASHGRPEGDVAHLPWPPCMWDEFEHLSATDADEQRDRSLDARYLESAARFRAGLAARIPSTNSDAVRSTT